MVSEAAPGSGSQEKRRDIYAQGRGSPSRLYLEAHCNLFVQPVPSRKPGQLLLPFTTPLVAQQHPASPFPPQGNFPAQPEDTNTENGKGSIRRSTVHLTAHEPLTDPRANKLALIPDVPRPLSRGSSPLLRSLDGIPISGRRRPQIRGHAPLTASDGYLGLERGGVDAVCVEALVDMSRRLDEGGYRLVRDDDVGGCDGLALV